MCQRPEWSDLVYSQPRRWCVWLSEGSQIRVMAKRSSFDAGTIITLGIAGAAAWWLYNGGWSSITSSLSSILLPTTTTVATPVVLGPTQVLAIQNLQDQANAAQDSANAATAAGNPNAALLQAQAANLALAASTAQADSSSAQVSNALAPTGLGFINRRNYRRVA